MASIPSVVIASGHNFQQSELPAVRVPDRLSGWRFNRRAFQPSSSQTALPSCDQDCLTFHGLTTQAAKNPGVQQLEHLAFPTPRHSNCPPSGLRAFPPFERSAISSVQRSGPLAVQTVRRSARRRFNLLAIWPSGNSTVGLFNCQAIPRANRLDVWRSCLLAAATAGIPAGEQFCRSTFQPSGDPAI
jgi:hypothetical protein